MDKLLIELDRKDLEAMIKGSELNYHEFDNPLVILAGHSYSDQYGKTSWRHLNSLTNSQIWELRIICKNSWK